MKMKKKQKFNDRNREYQQRFQTKEWKLKIFLFQGLFFLLLIQTFQMLGLEQKKKKKN